MTPQFTLDLEVRDYELDMQGIVNNSVYQNYLEHVRHKFLQASGLDFATLTRQDIHLVVAQATLYYKAPLTSGDRFRVGLVLRQCSRLRFEIMQDIRRLADGRCMLEARFIIAAMNAKGRPMAPPELVALCQHESN